MTPNNVGKFDVIISISEIHTYEKRTCFNRETKCLKDMSFYSTLNLTSNSVSIIISRVHDTHTHAQKRYVYAVKHKFLFIFREVAVVHFVVFFGPFVLLKATDDFGDYDHNNDKISSSNAIKRTKTEKCLVSTCLNMKKYEPNGSTKSTHIILVIYDIKQVEEEVVGGGDFNDFCRFF